MRTTALAAAAMAALSACITVPVRGSAPRGGARVPEREAAAPVDRAWLADVALPAHLERPAPGVESEIAEAVGRLGSDDFEAYSAATRRLVAIGVPAVPYVGHAAEQPDADLRLAQVVPAVLRIILEQAEPEPLGPFLGSRYRTVRIAAADVVGRNALAQHARELVKLLDDEDVDVRRAGVTALRRMSRRFHGYRADGPASARERAAVEWRKYADEAAGA